MKVDGRIEARRMASRDPNFLHELAGLEVGVLLKYQPKWAVRHYLRMLQNANYNWVPKHFIWKPLDGYLFVVRIR